METTVAELFLFFFQKDLKNIYVNSKLGPNLLTQSSVWNASVKSLPGQKSGRQCIIMEMFAVLIFRKLWKLSTSSEQEIL